jgi:hypothetical protein
MATYSRFEDEEFTPAVNISQEAQNSTENTDNSGMSKTSKILIGLAGASVAVGLIAVGIY